MDRTDKEAESTQAQPAKPDVMHITRTKRHMHLLERLAGGKTLAPGEMRELEEYERKPVDDKPQGSRPGICRTQLELAEVFQVGTRSIQKWTKAGCPRRADGSYEIIAVHTWHAARAAKAAGQPIDGDLLEGKDGDWWTARHRQLKAKQEEIHLDVLRGKLLPAAQVERDRLQRIVIVKTRLLALPSQIAPALVGLEPLQIQNLLDTRLREIIAEFAAEPEEEQTPSA